MSQVDEGLIHAWLDGQLPPDEAARVEQLVATDEAWGAAAADARGVVAGASRILGALDDVPSVRAAGAIGGAPRSRRSVWREPWFRAAAVVALAVGVGGVVMKRVPSVDAVVATKDATASVDSSRQRGAQNALALPGAAALPAVPNETRPVGAAERAAKDPAKRDEAVAAEKTALRQDAAARGNVAALGAVSSTRATDPVAGGGTAAGASAAATRPLVSADTGKASAQALQKQTAPVAPPSVGAARGSAGGGRGGRVADETLDQLSSLAAKSRESLIIDRRLAGCWLTVDSAPSRAYVLKFIDPVATDVRRVASAPASGQSAFAPQPAPRTLPRAPAGARIENTSPRRFGPDSSFSAEWITGNGRTTLVFTVQGDSIAGNTILAAGDVRYPPVSLRASRVQCPP